MISANRVVSRSTSSRTLRSVVGAALVVACTTTALAGQARSDGRLIRVPGAELHVRERGRGEPLLLLHGFLECGGAWDPFVAKLATRYRVIIVDLRGHGRSTNPSGAFTMRQSATDVLALLDSLRLPRVRAMGISAGGMTLLQAATREPARFQSLVLIGATPTFGDQARAVVGGITRATLPPPVLADFTRCASRGATQVDALLAQFRGFRDSRDDMTLTPGDLARISAPTLIVHGDRDMFFPVDVAIAMYGAIPTAQLWIVPNGDHVPIYDPLVPFADVALRFLQRAAPKP